MTDKLKPFDFDLYRKVARDPLEIILYQDMGVALEQLIDDAMTDEVQQLLLSCRSPVTVARMEFERAISAGMAEGQAITCAVMAYGDRLEDFALRSPEDEILHFADRKREMGVKLSQAELDEEMEAFLAKREKV